MNSSRVNDQSTLRQRRKRNTKHSNDQNALFSSKSSTKTKEHSNSSSSSAAEDAKNITQSLLRTKSLLTQELDRVTALNQTIDEDTARLTETSSNHMFLGNVVSGAKNALRHLKSQDHRESVVLWSSVIFFYISALYVVWTRIRIPFFLW